MIFGLAPDKSKTRPTSPMISARENPPAVIPIYTHLRNQTEKNHNNQVGTLVELKNKFTFCELSNKNCILENTITLHPVAKAILDKRRGRVALDADTGCISRLPSQEGALKCLDTWIRRAGIDKLITWNSARLSVSILLQDAEIDAATVALLLGHTSTKYVLNTYKRFRPKYPGRRF